MWRQHNSTLCEYLHGQLQHSQKNNLCIMDAIVINSKLCQIQLQNSFVWTFGGVLQSLWPWKLPWMLTTTGILAIMWIQSLDTVCQITPLQALNWPFCSAFGAINCELYQQVVNCWRINNFIKCQTTYLLSGYLLLLQTVILTNFGVFYKYSFPG